MVRVGWGGVAGDEEIQALLMQRTCSSRIRISHPHPLEVTGTSTELGGVRRKRITDWG